MRKIVLACGTAWALLSGPLNAEPSPVVFWLMKEPVSLFTRGMDAMWRDVSEAMDDEDMPSWHGIGVNYDRQDNEVLVQVFFDSPPPETTVSHDGCNAFRNRFIGNLVDFPGWENLEVFNHDGTVYGAEGEPPISELVSSVWIPDAVSSWFAQIDHQAEDRPDDLGERMSRIIFVEVSMSSGGGISCRDRITSLDAPSRPVQ